MDPVVHLDLQLLGFLPANWRGEGEGEWPPGEPFRYREEMTFEHVGDPFLLYAQRSWAASDGAPLHFERGFLRPAGPGRVELVLAHPLGIAEIAEGTVSEGALETASTTVVATATGSPVWRLERRIRVHGDRLTYELEMTTREAGPMRHLRGELRRG